MHWRAIHDQGLSGNPEIVPSSGLPASSLMGSLAAALRRPFDITLPFERIAAFIESVKVSWCAHG
jgi:hypothetical protein